MTSYEFVSNANEKTRHIALDTGGPQPTLCGLGNVRRHYGLVFEDHSGVCVPCIRLFAAISGNGQAAWAIDFLTGWLKGRRDTLEIPGNVGPPW